jgi:hypothetical protein
VKLSENPIWESIKILFESNSDEDKTSLRPILTAEVFGRGSAGFPQTVLFHARLQLKVAKNTPMSISVSACPRVITREALNGF